MTQSYFAQVVLKSAFCFCWSSLGLGSSPFASICLTHPLLEGFLVFRLLKHCLTHTIGCSNYVHLLLEP